MLNLAGQFDHLRGFGNGQDRLSHLKDAEDGAVADGGREAYDGVRVVNPFGAAG